VALQTLLRSQGAQLDSVNPPAQEEGREKSGWGRLAVGMLVLLTVTGLFARIVLSWYSLGTYDYAGWWGFSSLVAHHGPFKAYALDRTLNHPPLPLLWSGLALGVAKLTKATFPFVFRLAPIAADAGSCILLRRIAQRRGGPLWGWLAAAAFAWNLGALLDGAYHCNTDNICAFFTLLAAYQLADRRNFFRGGLALAAAINVKIVPVLLIPAFLSLCRDRASAGKFIRGLAIGAVPFLVLLCATPTALIRNVMFYDPAPTEWGLMLFPMYSQYIPVIARQATIATQWFSHYGKYPLLAMSAGLGILSWRLRRWNAYELGALAWCVFLVFTPGWGAQYTVFVAPLLMAANPGRGAVYGLVAGLYLLTAYAGPWDGTFPIHSCPPGPPRPNPLMVPLGLLAWGILLGYLGVTLRRGFRTPTTLALD
jgi:hypothetical protein